MPDLGMHKYKLSADLLTQIPAFSLEFVAVRLCRVFSTSLRSFHVCHSKAPDSPNLDRYFKLMIVEKG